MASQGDSSVSGARPTAVDAQPPASAPLAPALAIPAPLLQALAPIVIRRSQRQLCLLVFSGSMSIHDYVLKMKSIDGLTTAGQPFNDDNLILYILGGLGLEYDSVVVNRTYRGDRITLSNVQFLLQSQEMRIDQLNTTIADLVAPSSNYATRGRRNFPPSNPGRSTNHRSYGRGRGRGGNQNRVACQNTLHQNVITDLMSLLFLQVPAMEQIILTKPLPTMEMVNRHFWPTLDNSHTLMIPTGHGFEEGSTSRDGYSPRHKGYLCLHSSGHVYIASSVSFDENEFPFAHGFTYPSADTDSTLTHSQYPQWLPYFPTVTPEHAPGVNIDTTSCSPTQEVSPLNPLTTSHQSMSTTPHPTSSPTCPFTPRPTQSYPTVLLHIYLPISPATTSHSSTSISSPLPTRPTPHIQAQPQPSHPMITRAKANIHKPRVFTAFSLSPLAFLTEFEPDNVAATLKNPQWKGAMDTEYFAIKRNNS
uniref:Uncharacterized protein n=1 Tax=Cannabis sativa TaxID=3483 RepID=A0A803P1Q9_CANSA